LAVVVKSDCPTCQLIVPVLAQLADGEIHLTVVAQDGPGFPPGLSPLDDSALDLSFAMDIDTLPTLLRVAGGKEVARAVGWSRAEWEKVSGRAGLGPGLPEYRPGCGSRTQDPELEDRRAWHWARSHLVSRHVSLGELEDEAEAMFERGWTDGLPVVAPTEARVARMLGGTKRDPGEVVAVVPPDMAEATVEKVAINAVLAGCRPEYLPVVLAAVEAACTPEFNAHGVLATTYFPGPVVIVNGPAAKAIGMNSGINALGQGNRANATIGRALQLVIRNLGGGRPGEVDRATLGQPGKYTFCFAEDELGSPWEPLSVERGLPSGTSAVTVFAGEAPRAVFDQLSRQPTSLVRSFAACLRTVAHPKWPVAYDAVLVISPEHGEVFRRAGWGKDRLRAELDELLRLPTEELVQGAGGMAEGIPPCWAEANQTLPKLRPGGLLVVHAGGRAGLFSAIIGGWVSGPAGSEPVTKEVRA
jgi:hypothetical protein